MVRFLIGFVAVALFLVEPIFSLFSPFEWGSHVVYIVPRFLILFLIFLSIYYNSKQAIIYGFVFGLLYDVFYIDIIGLYMVLYPLLCFIASGIVKVIHKRLFVSAIISALLVIILEFIVYQFNLYIGHVTVQMMDFVTYRLISTVLANVLFIVMLMWIFSYLIRGRIFSEDV